MDDIAQNEPNATDSIQVTKRFLGYTYEQNGMRLNINDMYRIMRKNPTAYEYIKKARFNHTMTTALGGIGGFMIGFPVGVALAGGDPEWLMAAIGGGVILIAIPVGNAASVNTRNAVREFNAGLHDAAFHPRKPQLNFGTQQNGVGLALSF